VGGDFPFVVTNSGGVASGTITVALSGTNMSDFSLGMDGCTGTTLAAGANCTVNAHFSPSATSTGPESATLMATAAPGGSASANLTANAIVPAAISFDVTAASFGYGYWGYVSPPITLKLTNSGGSDSGMVTLTLGGTAPGQYIVSQDNCTGTSLASGGSCTVNAQFAPSNGTYGWQVATITADSTAGGTAVVTLYGNANGGG
jgi:hypothetical protein